MTTALACLTLAVLLVLGGFTAVTVDPIWHRTTAALVAATSLWSLVVLLRASGWTRAPRAAGPG